MSIITTAQAVPSRLFAIYSVLFESDGGETRGRLESLATPSSLSGRGSDDDGEPSTTLFTNALQEARRLELIEEVEDRLRLTTEARGGGKKGKNAEAHFRQHLQRVLFDPARAAETAQSGFMLALSWFMGLNPLRPIGFAEPPQNTLRAELGDKAGRTELTSLNRYQNFLYWARYLGFATILGGREAEDSGSRRVVADPVRAIQAALPTIFRDDSELPIDAFLTRLASVYPVFEGGSVREEYEALRVSTPQEPGRRLSIATSIALQRLEDRQVISSASIADAPTRVLDFGGRETRLSHVSLGN